MRRVGQADAWREVIFVGLLLRGKGVGERRSGQSLAKPRIQGGVLEVISGSTPVFVTKAEIQREVLPNPPGVLNVGSIVGEKRMDDGIPKEFRDASAGPAEV